MALLRTKHIWFQFSHFADLGYLKFLSWFIEKFESLMNCPFKKGNTLHIALFYREDKLGHVNWSNYFPVVPRNYVSEIHDFFLHLLALKSSFKQQQQKSLRMIQLLGSSIGTLPDNHIEFSIKNAWWTLRIKGNTLKYAWILNTVT